MTQTISDCVPTRLGYRIDRAFIDQFVSIVTNVSSQATFEIEIKAGAGRYKFDTPSEFYNAIDSIVEYIDDFTLCGFLPSNSVYSNKVKLHLEKPDFYSYKGNEITYDFDDEKVYRLLKTKISALLQNQIVGHIYITALPYFPFALSFNFFLLFSSLSSNSIISPYLIPLLCFDMVFLAFSLSRDKVFPKNEIEFGVNVKKDSRIKSARTFILVGVLLSIILGVAGNIVYARFFNI